jgi:hypothetical protein
MAQDHLSEIVQALKRMNSGVHVTPFGSHQMGLSLETRSVRIGWISTQATFFGEFSSEDVPSGKLLTQRSDVVVQTVEAWLLSKSNLSEMNRVHTEFIPTQDGLAFERNTLRELRWSRLAEIAPPSMKHFVTQALSHPELHIAYPMFSLDDLALLSAPTSGKIASVRRAENNSYEVLDLKETKSLGIGDAQRAIARLSNLVSQSRLR